MVNKSQYCVSVLKVRGCNHFLLLHICLDIGIKNSPITCLGELKGFLYICDRSSSENVTMWVMNEYGIGESWTKIYNIDTYLTHSGLHDPWRCGLCWLVKHYEPEKYGFKAFRIDVKTLKGVEVIQHIPSLISLKDVVNGDNVEEVLNIYSRIMSVSKNRVCHPYILCTDLSNELYQRTYRFEEPKFIFWMEQLYFFMAFRFVTTCVC
ncbi:hypothetical protein MtrunA17_Chr5g0397861 [Medicago truncatula]|uniref:F-box associated interaction domain-containing protein n=1 Tax=Medicago truncatula TaxID=3880 RepID=A0A396HQJ6_MEDTR|nr:hypothetical protein MtrunA17_Chr5g0397861 [Medicago truncatula]